MDSGTLVVSSWSLVVALSRLVLRLESAREAATQLQRILRSRWTVDRGGLAAGLWSEMPLPTRLRGC